MRMMQQKRNQLRPKPDVNTLKGSMRQMRSSLPKSLHFLLSGLVLVSLAGCSTPRRIKKQDRAAADYYRAAQGQALPGNPANGLPVDAYLDYLPAPGQGSLALNLRKSLSLAVMHSREYQTYREDLYLAAVRVYLENYHWGWTPSNSFGAAIGRSLESNSTTPLEVDGSVGFSRRLKYGGQFSAGYSLAVLKALSGSRDVSWASLLNFSLSQPLWGAAASPLVARESLTQAERSLIYKIRTYERQRKSLLIDIASKYYSVLQKRDALSIAELNLKRLKENRERSELMAKTGRIPMFQADQARQDELSASTSLIEAQQSVQDAQDSLKQAIGLPTTVTIVVDPADLDALRMLEMPVPPLTLEVACDLAQRQRLDFRNAQDQVADAERAVAIAAENLKGVLKLQAGYNTAANSSTGYVLPVVRDGDLSLGLSGELPWDRVDEAAQYRQAQISLDRGKRSLAKEREDLVAGIRDSWRRLQSSAENYRIQVASIELAKRRVESTEMLFEAGKVDMRDVLSARDSLITSQNSLTSGVVNHRLSLMRLLLGLELLDTEATTLWSPDMDSLTPDKIKDLFK
jgi:outer membrane protein TolC